MNNIAITQRMQSVGHGSVSAGAIFFVLLFAAVFITGCGTYRGIPTHGGGKRFDEEQRIVAESIRKAISGMELSALNGRNVQVVLNSIGHEGNGWVNWPGMQSISSNITGNINADNSQSSYSWFPVGSAQAYVLANYQPRLSMGASSSTYADVEYLRSVLDMKLRLEGVNEVLGSSDAILYVLVDVLGTNRSHTEKILGFCEEYAATCELTYYAVNSAGNVFILPCQSAAISCYKEDYQFGNETPQIQRTTWAIPPMVKTPPALAMKNFSPRKETIPASTTRPADSTSSQPFSPAQPSGDSHASQRPLFQAIVQFRLW